MIQLLEGDTVSVPLCLHLLLLASPERSTGLNSSNEDLFPPAFPGVTWDVTPDLYAALTRLVTFPTAYHALVLDSEVLTQALVTAIPLLLKYRQFPVWVLDQGRISPQIDRALSAGAMRLGEALAQPEYQRSAVPEEAPRTDLITQPSPVPDAVNGHSQNEMDNTPPEHETIKRRTGFSADSLKISQETPNAISNEASKSYDTAATGSPISVEEMRALLGP